jgi:hypothetical protein
MLSRKDYENIASAIYISKNEKENYAFRYLVNELCNRFLKDNPRFNAEKFKKACLRVSI